MTAVLLQPDQMTGWEDDEFIEPAIPCSIQFKVLETGETQNCPRETKYDAFVTCAEGHERTQHYCEKCQAKALRGEVDCRVCKIDMNKKPFECPVTILALFPRKQA